MGSKRREFVEAELIHRENLAENFPRTLLETSPGADDTRLCPLSIPYRRNNIYIYMYRTRWCSGVRRSGIRRFENRRSCRRLYFGVVIIYNGISRTAMALWRISIYRNKTYDAPYNHAFVPNVYNHIRGYAETIDRFLPTRSLDDSIVFDRLPLRYGQNTKNVQNNAIFDHHAVNYTRTTYIYIHTRVCEPWLKGLPPTVGQWKRKIYFTLVWKRSYFTYSAVFYVFRFIDFCRSLLTTVARLIYTYRHHYYYYYWNILRLNRASNYFKYRNIRFKRI